MESRSSSKNEKVRFTSKLAKMGSGIGKGFNLTRQYLEEKVGSADALKTEESEQFVHGKTVLKKCRINLGEILKAVKDYNAKLHAVSASSDILKKALEDYSGELDCTEGLGAALTHFSKVQQKVGEEVAIMGNSIMANVHGPIQNFINNEIADVRTVKTNYYRARVQFDASRSKLARFVDKKAEKIDPLKLRSIDKELAEARANFEGLKIDVEDKLLDIEKQIEFRVLDNLRVLMDIQARGFSASNGHLSEMQGYLNELEQFATDSRVLFLQEQDERARQLEQYKVETEAYIDMPLLDLISSPSASVLTAICELHSTEENDAILEDVLKVLEHYERSMPLIRACISAEVENTSSPQTLFRVNTTATRLITGYTKLVAQKYINSTIKTAAENVISGENDAKSYEVDPVRIEEGVDVSVNIDILEKAAEQFLSAILASLEACPLGYRLIINHLQQEVQKRFPDSRTTIVGSFVFLRGFCPAITRAGSGHSSDVMRAFILITKILQNLANGVEFGGKEPYMTPLNELIQQYQQFLFNWLDELANVDQNIQYGVTVDLDAEEVNTVIIPRLVNQLETDLDSMGKKLLTGNNKNDLKRLSSILAQREFELGKKAIGIENMSRSRTEPMRPKPPRSTRSIRPAHTSKYQSGV